MIVCRAVQCNGPAPSASPLSSGGEAGEEDATSKRARSGQLASIDIIDLLAHLSMLRDVPGHIRSHNGPQFIVGPLEDWAEIVPEKVVYIARTSWKNGSTEPFSTMVKDEFLDGPILLLP